MVATRSFWLSWVPSNRQSEIDNPQSFDALGRRIRKVISDGGLPGTLSNDTVDYLYDGVQCIEERDDSDDPIRQYVWGQYVDELIQQREIGDTDYYMLSDLLYRASVLTNSSGTVQETYDCDAYGNTQIFDDNPTRIYDPICQFIFTGRRFDPETWDENTQIYFYRARYYSPQLGRFLSRDPLGYVDGMSLYEYVGSRPTVRRDPTGFAEGEDLPLKPADIVSEPKLPVVVEREATREYERMAEYAEKEFERRLKQCEKEYRTKTSVPLENEGATLESQAAKREYQKCFERAEDWLQKYWKLIPKKWRCCGPSLYDPTTHVCCGKKVYDPDPARCCLGDERAGTWGYWRRAWELKRYKSYADCVIDLMAGPPVEGPLWVQLGILAVQSLEAWDYCGKRVCTPSGPY